MRENIFIKLLKNFKSFLCKNKQPKMIAETTEANLPVLQTNDNNIDYLKVEFKTDTSKKEKAKFMKKLEEKPELLENFTINRLEIILAYYKEENERKMRILKKLED